MKKAAIILLIFWCVSSYPLNYVMMKRGTGFYNNDPDYEWYLASPAYKQGPSREGRFWCFVASPVITPACGLMALTDGTIPK